MEKTLRHWMMLALMVLCMGGLLTACEKEDDAEETSDKTIVSKDYKDYVGSAELKGDVENMVECALTLQAMKWEIYKNCTDNFNVENGLVGDPKDADWYRYFQLGSQLVQKQDVYEAAMTRLDQKGVLTTKTPQTRMVVSIVSGINKIVDALNGGAEKIMKVMSQPGMNNNAAWERCWNTATAGRNDYKLGCSNFREWRIKINNGDTYGLAGGIFKVLNEDPDFYNAASNIYGDQAGWKEVKRVAGKNLEAGVGIYSGAAGTGGDAVGKMIDAYNVVESAGQLKKAIDEGKNPTQAVRNVITTTTNVVVNDIVGSDANYGMTETVNGLFEVYRGVEENLNEAEAALYGTDDDSGTGVIEVEDKDTKSPGSTVIAETPDGRTIIAAGRNGKTRVPTTQKGKYTLNTFDNTGDKNTTEVNVSDPSGTTKVEVNTNESELIESELTEADMEVELDPDELEFGADEDWEVIDVYTQLKYFSASSDQKWLKVATNASTVQVHVDENTTGKDRTGTITISFYQDELQRKVVKNVTVPVVQRKPAEYDLSFINWNKFRIEGFGPFSVDQEDGWQYSIYMNYYSGQGNEYTKFSHNDLQIEQKGDSYQVKAVYDNESLDRETGLNERLLWFDELQILPNKKYGLHYELTFSVVPTEPSLLVPKNSFKLTDINLKGYMKYMGARTYRPGDRYEEFDYHFDEIGVDYSEYDYGENPGEMAVLSLMGEGLSSRLGTVKRSLYWWNVELIYDSKNDTYTLVDAEYKSKTDNREKNSSIVNDCRIVVRWD